jgi:hypothetical protein
VQGDDAEVALGREEVESKDGDLSVVEGKVKREEEKEEEKEVEEDEEEKEEEEEEKERSTAREAEARMFDGWMVDG